ncbi:BTAD domain-containing putative transcriptional regulator [Streptomyces sp. WAC06614]|uniref:AfsR/SARP family transcriptional regulator n=1 Tax=Streptomyces sp. WAC06614 TaxID=2487416 RepID=UPI00163BB95D|nr:BTAD domain-containing putative transcriptional regulator [Streptomyces sp. WAC06614]
MRVQLFGQVELRYDDGTSAVVTSPKRAALLSALAMDLNEVVPTTRLMELMWAGKPSATARTALHGHVSGLRKLLDDSLELAVKEPGYRLVGSPDQVDVHRFDTLCATAAATEDDTEAVRLLREALGLWCGDALAGCGSPLLRDERGEQLEESRRRALEQLAERLLRLGRGGEAVAALTPLTENDPARESAAALLMRCLDQEGRGEEALAVYGRTVEHLADRHGTEPGALLLAARDRLTTSGRVSAIQIPLPDADFTGRAREIAWLDRAASAPEPTPLLVTGAAGIGKTSLVLHWAHDAVERFPDGRFHLDLRGFDEAEPVEPGVVLTAFLRALGVDDAEIPRDLEERSALYRGLMAGRRALVVLDNARSYEQVLPLLSDGPGPVTVITSRNRLTDLVVQEGAVPISLDVLDRQDALDLVARVAGAPRVAADPEAGGRLVDLCDGLPLALRVAVARLAARPDLPLGQLAGELEDEQRRLAALATPGSLDVTAALSLTLRTLPAAAARLFALLGLHPGQYVDPYAAAALAGVPVPSARALLAQLDAAHIVEEASPGLFARHDLIRLYTRELATDLPAADRRTALDRLLDFYLAATVEAVGAVGHPGRGLEGQDGVPAYDTPPLSRLGQALQWFRREERAIRHLVQAAADQGRQDTAWRLSHSAAPLYFYDGGYLNEREHIARTALRAAQDSGSLDGHVRASLDLVGVLMDRMLLQESIDLLESAVALADRLGDGVSRRRARFQLAVALMQTGRNGRAIQTFEEAVTIAEETNDPLVTARGLNNLAHCLLTAGRPADALAHLERAMAMLDGHQPTAMLLYVLITRAQVLNALRRFEEALEEALSGMELSGELRMTYKEAVLRRECGTALRGLGRPAEAALQWRRALELRSVQGLPCEELREMLASVEQEPDHSTVSSRY